MDITVILVGLVALLFGALIMMFYRNWVDKNTKRSAEREAQRIIQKAKSKSSKIEKDAHHQSKEFEKRARRNAEADIRKQKENLSRIEKSYKDKERSFDQKFKSKETQIETKFREIKNAEELLEIQKKKVSDQQHKLKTLESEYSQKITNVAQINPTEAKKEVMEKLKEEVKIEVSKDLVSIEEDIRDKADKKAKRILSLAVSRYAGEYAAERTSSIIPLPSEDLKGKIIGKEGRNIRAFESICGIDLILDEVPDAVVISAFDPVRREVAKRALEKLFEDGRVHPGRIEEAVDKVKKGLFKSIRDDGEKACLELGITGVHKQILDLTGSLKYRTSYSQNNYTHSIEVGYLAGMMAAELNEDVFTARRAGLLHDIGKAMDHSIEGSHAVIGADFAKKHGENERVCHAIRSHHEDEKPNSVIAHLVQAADALSSARPGARKQTQDTYIKRLEDLESIGNSFDGVLRTYAVQSGREVRVIVDTGRVTDEQSVMLSRDIAKKIERELNYPGQIKITVVRETRAVEHAR